jgi:hemin uptake protein HemP
MPLQASQPAVSLDPVELTSHALLGGRREILIRHGEEQYRLRLTRMNKLILTK